MLLDSAPVEVSRHKCLIYDGDPSEQLPVIVPLLMDGLEDRHRCLYLGDPRMVGMVGEALGKKGVDVPGESRRGALVFSSDRSHLEGGGFDPRAMVSALRKLTDDAVRDGYQGLCATGDMRWELGEDKSFDRLQEYESLLEQVFHEKPLRGICQYHRHTVPARAVRDALLTHRSLYLGSSFNEDNLFYIPPELLLEDLDPSLRDKQGEWMCRQITRIMAAERRRDEALAALRRSEADLASANRDLERRVRERTSALEAANRELESFSYSVSHDLRAPLRSIDGFSRALLEDEHDRLSADGKASLDRVLTATARMGLLIDDMLRLSRVARAAMARQEVDLSAMAGEILQDLRRGSPARPVQTVVREDLKAQGDASLLRAAMTNLLGNAWKFTSKTAAARIEVGLTRSVGGEEAFFVSDNGAGFDMAYVGKLFGAFHRLHEESDFPGTGVGLATVQRILSRHGGRIWAEGAVGRGATFFFTLPARGD
jgi:signal transduction histidine kinase